ncbi:MAG: CDP-alcohol phosphatidyltransferase family protein [Desulfobacterales bacterium]
MNQLRPGEKPDSVVDKATYVNLRRQWWLVVLLGALTIIAGTGVLFCCFPLPSSLMGSIPLALVTIYVLYLLGCNLRLNTRGENQVLRATLGPANWITLARGGLIAILAGFLLQPWPGRPNGPGWTAWIPGAIYIAAVVGDALDGFIARITTTPSRLGNLLDTRIDALGILVACLLAIHYGQIPDYYIIAGLAYYLMRLAIWVRRKGGRPCLEVRPRPGARVMAGIQMAFLGIVLLPLLSPRVIYVAAVLILVPFLAGFLLDWQMVCRHENSD